MARAELVLGDRARRRFLLADAQYVVARELGYRSWPELRRAREEATVAGTLDGLARLERGETLVDSRITYGDGEPVEIRIRKRIQRYDLDDRGRAVAKSGKRPGWLDVAQIAGEPMNVGRNGTVFVPAHADRDLASLVVRLAAASRAVHEALLDLDEAGRRYARTGPATFSRRYAR